MPAKKKTITVPRLNLYPEDPFYESLFGKALRWAVSVGRHIIIMTEIVVIGSFGSRFVLDRQLTDLNTSILQKQAIVESYGTLEEDFRLLQKKTDDVKGILNQQGKTEVMEMMARITPNDMEYTQISYNNDRLVVYGKVQSNRGLSLFLNSLQAQQGVSEVSVSEIQSGDDRDPALGFQVNAVYRVGPGATK